MEKLYQPGMHYSPGQSHTLYAKWEADRYLLRIDPAGGNILEDQIKDFVKKEAGYERVSDYEEKIDLPLPVKTGYVFKGWYRDKKCTRKVTSIKKGSTGKITLYAKWKKK